MMEVHFSSVYETEWREGDVENWVLILYNKMI